MPLAEIVFLGHHICGLNKSQAEQTNRTLNQHLDHLSTCWELPQTPESFYQTLLVTKALSKCPKWAKLIGETGRIASIVEILEHPQVFQPCPEMDPERNPQCLFGLLPGFIHLPQDPGIPARLCFEIIQELVLKEPECARQAVVAGIFEISKRVIRRAEAKGGYLFHIVQAAQVTCMRTVEFLISVGMLEYFHLPHIILRQTPSFQVVLLKSFKWRLCDPPRETTGVELLVVWLINSGRSMLQGLKRSLMAPKDGKKLSAKGWRPCNQGDRKLKSRYRKSIHMCQGRKTRDKSSKEEMTSLLSGINDAQAGLDITPKPNFSVRTCQQGGRRRRSIRMFNSYF